METVFFFFKQKTAYALLRGLVGSEMCIRDRSGPAVEQLFDNLQLLDGAYQGSVADMVDRIQKLMGAALRD